MFTNIDNIELIVKLLKANGIQHIIISPGGTNIPFVRAVQDDDFFKCYSIVDERSAVYFAIGIYLQTGCAVAMSCTSAQATRNYIPGLTEAFYKRVPILAITMSKHPRFVGQEYMQAPDQISLPTDSVKKSFMLPYISDKNDYLFSGRLINEAILELTNDGLGPVQLCVPWLDFEIEGEKEVGTIHRHLKIENMQARIDGRRIMIVVGEHRPFTPDEISALDSFCEAYNCVVYTNHLSNCDAKYKICTNLEFTLMGIDMFCTKYKPDILISIGGQTGDYPFYKLMSNISVSGIEHWRISEDGDIVDTYDKLTDVFKMSICDFFNSFELMRKTNHDFYKAYIELVGRRKYMESYPFSNVYIADKLHKLIPKNSTIQFSILNSLRVWNLFELDPSLKCYSNVGAFGIDGGLSTLIGQSVVSDDLCFMVIGDLAFFYDMNALGIRHIKNNVRILLINNNGGIEFKLSTGKNEGIDRYIAAANHFKSAKGWSESCGFRYLKASDPEEFDRQIDLFIGESDCPILFEVFVEDADEAKAYNELINKNSYKDFDLGEKLKKGVKTILHK